MSIKLVDYNNCFVGTVEFFEAHKMARERNLDIVLVDGKSNTYKLINAGKLKYDQKKSKEPGSKKTKIKSIKITPNIADNDLLVKIKQIKTLLACGHKAKVSVTMHGRQLSFKSLAEQKLYSVINEITKDGVAKLEHPVKLEGHSFVTTLTNHKKS